MSIAPVPLRRRGSSYLKLSLVVGLIASSLLVWQTSRAAFTDETVTGSNTMTAGAVGITNQRSGQVLMSALALTPTDTLVECVTVTYTSTVASNVKIYAKAFTNAAQLGALLTIQVEEGIGGVYGNCAAFVATGAPIIPTESLATFGARTNYAQGAGAWAPASTATIVYRITIDFPSTASDNTAMGDSVDVTFGWTAQSS